MTMRQRRIGTRPGALASSAAAALLLATLSLGPSRAEPAGVAGDGPGGSASWTTGNKVGVGTSATTTSKVWFTIAQGITTEVFHPRLDVPNLQDMQYVVTDGATFVDLERDATDHAVSMPDEKALEYTVTNTDRRTPPRYRITSTYVTDPERDTMLVRTTFESLDGGRYRLYLLENPSMAGGAASDDVWWDGASAALLARGTETLFGAPLTVVSALAVSSPHGFGGHDDGYVGAGSDCLVDLRAHRGISQPFDKLASPGNAVQCGEIGGIGPGATTFTVALGFGADPASALAAANGSLAAGFDAVEASYRSGWHAYLDTPPIRPPPASVSGVDQRRRAYLVALMALHAAEDKTFPGANVAGFATPWGDFQNGDTLNDGYHRVWGRDLYQQATGLIAAGDMPHAQRMARFMWERQYVSTPAEGDGVTYPAGSFPRYSPVSGIAGATPKQLGCCSQLDQDADAILLAWMTGLTDAATFARIKMVADHIQAAGPKTTERWEEQNGRSPSSIAAEIAGLLAAADIARQNQDPASAARWEATADGWRASLPDWTLTHTGTWGGSPGHGTYFERIDQGTNPDDTDQLSFDEGKFWERDVADFGFLELVRLGVYAPDDARVAGSLAPSAQASDGNGTVQVTLPNGDVHFRRYNHDNYGESNDDCSGWPAGKANRFGRAWPVLAGERGEYELANGRPASAYLASMANAVNEGYFVPEQIWDRGDVHCFKPGRPTGSAAPLNWAEGQYLRLAQALDAGRPLETPSVVKARYRGAGPIRGAGDACLAVAGGSANGSPAVLTTCPADAQRWAWDGSTGTLRTLGKCLDVRGGRTASGTKVQLWDCNGTEAQEWRWHTQTALVNPKSGRCLDASRAATAQGVRLQIRDCSGSAAQAWHLP